MPTSLRRGQFVQERLCHLNRQTLSQRLQTNVYGLSRTEQSLLVLWESATSFSFDCVGVLDSGVLGSKVQVMAVWSLGASVTRHAKLRPDSEINRIETDRIEKDSWEPRLGLCHFSNVQLCQDVSKEYCTWKFGTSLSRFGPSAHFQCTRAEFAIHYRVWWR